MGYQPSPGVESEIMTAIASVFTPEGFIIGADGRLKNGLGKIQSDSIQKVFRCTANNICAAFAWAGQTRIPGRTSDFDFKAESQQSLSEISTLSFASMDEYIKAFMCNFYSRMTFWLPEATVPLGEGEIARITMLGYVEGASQMANAYLYADKGTLKLPSIGLMPNMPAEQLNVFSGKKAVYEAMYERGMITPCKTLTEAATQVNHFIETCAGNPPDDSNDTGGDIHIAAVTPARSFWVLVPFTCRKPEDNPAELV
jgi:hypothetical protein